MDFILRPFEMEDAQSIAKYANNLHIAANLTDAFPYPYTLPDAKSFIKSCQDEKNQCCRAIVINGEAAGSIGFYVQQDVYRLSAEMGYWLAEPYWGNGIVARGITEMCDYAFSHYGLIRIFAKPYAYNKGSCQVLEKAGFKLEGMMESSVIKNGQVYGAYLYAKIKN